MLKKITLEEKIILAEEVIRKAYIKNNGKLFISFSGGKDSTILRHIALKLYPNLPVVFSNTTNELNEIIKYIKTFPNIITVTPKYSFKEVIKKYGFPLVSKEVSQKVNDLKNTHGKTTRNTRFYGDKKGNGRLSTKWRFLAEQEFNVTHKCCAILKKNPLEKWAKERGLKPIIALMADESNLRQQLALYGTDSEKKIYPFLKTEWTEQDIWEYAKKYNIRFAECYYDRIINGKVLKARKRTGCEYCGFGITLEKEDRFERSKLSSPKRYESMMKLENNGITFKEAIDLVKKKNNKPIIDLYGVKFKVKNQFKKNWDCYSLDNTTITKVCPHCNSKNIKIDYKIITNYFDTPDPITKKIRNMFVDNIGYECKDCKSYFNNDLHMFNNKHMVTNRLIEYIELNLNKKNFNDIINETGLSFEQLYLIVKDIYNNLKKG